MTALPILDESGQRVVHTEVLPSTDAVFGELDRPLPADLRARLAAQGIERLYIHQVEAVTHLRAGRPTMIVAGTASGKSLCYQLPILESLLTDSRATALLLHPTKALGRDQVRALRRYAQDGDVAAYDGDTPAEDRRVIRERARVVVTTPDMLHVGILPNHRRWQPFLEGLRYVVVDEVHTLRGVFGSHVALLLARLRRLADHYGGSPTVAMTSATIGNPADIAAALAGAEAEVVDRDGSPQPERAVVVWNPPLEDEDLGLRASALREATSVFVRLVAKGTPTIAFCRTRRSAELLAMWARRELPPIEAQRVDVYRGGFSPEERRRVEDRLAGGDLLGVSATTALELGIDIGHLEASVIASFPGTVSSFRQMSGRSGRRGQRALTVLVTGQDALDQYFASNPAELFTRPPEAAVVNPTNPRIYEAHLGCASYELPLRPSDALFLGDDLDEAATRLAGEGLLRLRDGGLHWAQRRAPAPQVPLRSSGKLIYDIVDGDDGSHLGTVDEGRAHHQVHPGAVYLHQGDSYVVEHLDRQLGRAIVRRQDVAYYTQPHEEIVVEVLRSDGEQTVGRLQVGVGVARVDTHVVAYRKKSTLTGEVLDVVPLDLPPVQLTTDAVWFRVPAPLHRAARLDERSLLGTLHAAEHTAIAMLPLFAICDRWDVGGLSTNWHQDLGSGGGWFIYDGYDGGAGIAAIGYARAAELLEATQEALASCPCRTGCPSCVQSPKCGNFNEPLDKPGAVRLLRAAAIGG